MRKYARIFTPRGDVPVSGAGHGRSTAARATSARDDLGTILPDLWRAAIRPFIATTWNFSKRLTHLTRHYLIVRQSGQPFFIKPDQYLELFSIELGETLCRVTLDQPPWLLRDGLLTISLWSDIHRAFSLSFCFSDAGGIRTAYVGGIQGRRHEDALAVNRILTKDAHGLRPRDLLFELFRMMCTDMGIVRIRCVSNAIRCNNTRGVFRTVTNLDGVFLDYDEVWSDRGGVLQPDGFFDVPVALGKRSADEIPAKKRTLYSRRYALVDLLEQRMAAALASPLHDQAHAPQPPPPF